MSKHVNPALVKIREASETFDERNAPIEEQMMVHERAVFRNFQTRAVDPKKLDPLVDEPAKSLRLRIRRAPTIATGPAIPVEAEEHDVAAPDTAGQGGGTAQ